MSDFGADVFDQERPKGQKHRSPEDDRQASLPAQVEKQAVAREPVAKEHGPRESPAQAAQPPQAAQSARLAGQLTQAAVPGLPDTARRAEAGALPPMPADSARSREPRPAREPARRFEPNESRWRDDSRRIPSRPPREPAEHHRPPAHHRPEPQGHSPHKERHTEFRSHHEPGEGRPQRERNAGREPVRPIERNPSTTAAQTVGLLVDLEGLQAEARAQQGELAMHRLRAGLGGGRTVAKALAIAKNAGAAPSGFDLIVSSGGFAAGVQFAAAAVELLRVAPVLVMAPTSDPIRKLATALRGAGHTVELAGFAATDAIARRLGRDCLFVP